MRLSNDDIPPAEEFGSREVEAMESESRTLRREEQENELCEEKNKRMEGRKDERRRKR